MELTIIWISLAQSQEFETLKEIIKVRKNKPLKEIAREFGKETSDYREALSSYLGVEAGPAESHGGSGE